MNIKDITKDQFRRYESVRKSGVTNMWSYDVQDYACIDKATHLAIIEHYASLCQKWPDIRNLTKENE